VWVDASTLRLRRLGLYRVVEGARNSQPGYALKTARSVRFE